MNINYNSHHLKVFKSLTGNKGKTIILEDGLSQAIAITRNWIEAQGKEPPSNMNEYDWQSKEKRLQDLNDCVEEITHGNKPFAAQVQTKIDEFMGIIDDIYPIFSLNKQGYVRSSDEGTHCSPELLAAGEEQCLFKPKHSTEKALQKLPSGEGAYRILINTDVSWWGQADDNCAMAACIILLLQRYAPVEVWIQQGWLGSHPDDGVTLFKLDYSVGLDLANLAFWIASSMKDIPFSLLVNKALGRYRSDTSRYSEIENDIMLRGDWFKAYGMTENAIHKMMHTERLDLMSKWIAGTSYKIIYGDGPETGYSDIFGNTRPPTITG